MNIVVTVFVQNRIDFNHIKDDFEKFMNTFNITTELKYERRILEIEVIEKFKN